MTQERKEFRRSLLAAGRRGLLVAIPVATVVGLTLGAYGAVQKFSGGEPLSASKLNANFDDVQGRLAALEATSHVPVGSVVAFAGAAVPAGWLLCDGALLDGTNPTYVALFAAVGTAHGGVFPHTPTSKPFNLPDYRGRFLRGVDHGAGRDPDRLTRAANPGGNAGDLVGSKQNPSVGPHTHTITPFLAFSGPVGAGGAGYTPGGQPFLGGSSTDLNTGETRPGNMNVEYIIKF